MAHEDDTQVPLASDLFGENGSKSLLDALAEKRRVAAETREVDLGLPGYTTSPPMLYARYRLLDGAELTRIADKVQRETKNRTQRGMLAAADTFIAACVGFYVDLGDGILQPLTYKGEHITGYNSSLAEALGFADKIADANLARDVVFGMFGNNDASVAQHNFLLNRWFGDTSVDVSQEMLAGNL